MKSLVKIVLLTLLSLFVCVKVNAVSLPQTLRIGIIFNSVSSNPISITASGGVYIKTLDGAVLYRNASGVVVTAKKSLLSGIDAEINGMIAATAQTELVLEPASGNLSLNGIAYRGTINICRQNGGELDAINVVEINDYVRGVVAKEIGGASPTEALKAQAVCARNYAAANVNKHRARGFDLCNTEHCQVYGGINAETEAVNSAVDATRNVIATHGGGLAELIFAASTGGYTESSEFVWGSKIPYLVAVPSPDENPNAYYISWKYEVTPAEATEILKAYELGDIKNIEILEQTPRGVTTKLRVVGSVKEKVFALEACRTLFGYSGLRSQAYTMEKVGGDTIQGTAEVWGMDSSGKALKIAGDSFSVKSAEGQTDVLLSDFWVKSSSESTRIIVPKSGSGGTIEKFIFTGRGWGHLVGMSQEGAIAMAKKGASYQEILKHYYTGITLE
ncbi:MAG: SpoIID/LytB domain-containing protein [Clostridiales bacterium]|nr:SpoIID/LytB domain-containing protein [Clostridiales bacterium]